ncbi:MAG: Loki-CTERM sorting domain-containing protein [Promethearchaeota archaeon]
MTCGLSLGMLFSSPIVIQDADDFSNPKSSAGEITIITPENKTYTEADSGYYPATYGFENDVIGESPQGWTEFSEADRKTTVEELYGEHKRVFKIYKNTAAALTTVNYFESQSTGTVEFWWVVEDIYDAFTFVLDDDGPWAVNFGINDGYFNYRDSSVYHTIPGAPIPQNNQWYHIRIDFRCTGAPAYQGLNENRYIAYIDGINYGDFPFVENKPFFKRSRFSIGTGSIETTYVDAVGYSWDPNYNIGDNRNEGLLLSYENTTTLDWQGYSLDGQVNNTIMGNATIPMPIDGLHNIQVFGNGTLGTIYESNTRYFSVNSTPYISISTPENKTYTEPDSGCYAATYGFENDLDGKDPSEWILDEGGGPIDVVNSIGGHSKIVEINKDGTTDWPHMRNNFSTSQTSGTVEFWMRSNDVTDQSLVYLSGTEPWMVTVGIDNDHFVWVDDSGLQYSVSCSNNVWYHIRIDFECGSGAYEGLSADHFYFYINGERYGEYEFRNSGDSMDYIDIFVWETSVDYYYDAIGYSWDPDYSIGDNLNEGLLLSYDNTTVLDWQGYSLDSQTNRTILGNTTISMPADGGHHIQVFGNDTMGTMYESDLRYFSVNTAPPEVTINSPTPSQTIGTTAPSYDLSITGPYDSIWYTLDGGTTNLTANSLTGTINQAAWTALTDGIITIDFYANNSAGMEGTAQVQVIKDSSVETPLPGIPGYDLYILLGAISIISTILIKKRFKS